MAKGARAWVGHHIGDLRNEETLRSFTEGVAHFERLFAVTPEVVAHDLHPDYLSTTYALAREGVEHVAVQHHHAHLAAVLAEHGERGPAIGAIYDGTGYGTDGTVWGGELLAGDLDGFERAGHLWPVRLPGGDRAVRQPWRMACAWLAEVQGAEPAPLPGIEPRTWHAVAELARTGLAAPLTTSMGRLFDAVAALCGLRTEVDLRGPGGRRARGGQPIAPSAAPTRSTSPRGVLDARGTVAAVGRTSGRRRRRRRWSARAFIARSRAQRLGRAPSRRRARPGHRRARRRRVAEPPAARAHDADLLRDAGLRVLVPERLPPNDGAISFGQAAVAAALERPPPR